MRSAALKYCPVQYPEQNDLHSWAQQGAGVGFSGSLRRGPFAVPTGKNYELPIKLRKESLKLSSHKGSNICVLATSAVYDSEASMPEPLVVKQLPAIEQPRFIILQQWEGVVLNVSSDSFIAKLINQTDMGPDQEAEFSKEEIDQPDHYLIKPGAVFYWTLGYSDSPGGQRNRISSLRFRRLPAWNKKDIEAAKLEAQKLINEINWQ